MSYSGEYNKTETDSNLTPEEIEQANAEQMDKLNKMLFARYTPAQIEAEKGSETVDAAKEATATGDITEPNKDRIDKNEPTVTDGAEFSPGTDAANMLRFAGYSEQTVGGDINGGERKQALENTVIDALKKPRLDSAKAERFNEDVEEIEGKANEVLAKLGLNVTREEAMEMVAGASIRNNLNDRAPVEDAYNTTLDRWGRRDAAYALIASKVTETVSKGNTAPLLFLTPEAELAVMNAVTSGEMAGNMTNQRGYEAMAPLGRLIENSLVTQNVIEELPVSESAPTDEQVEMTPETEEAIPEEQLIEALLESDDERADQLAQELALPEDLYINAKERAKNLLENNKYIEKPFDRVELREIIIDMLTPKDLEAKTFRDIYDTAA